MDDLIVVCQLAGFQPETEQGEKLRSEYEQVQEKKKDRAGKYLVPQPEVDEDFQELNTLARSATLILRMAGSMQRLSPKVYRAR